ncbi:hypothetical protein HPP92_024558 [Vanilla planifolia]|uniref:Uncharacterized protein n=1 Tax=Vanilla planifolia TaxID=51239 RepID=A0A835PN63_VANPL|nr:hypothetical protein HPP92_024558 [Vanilla planifolia]
MWWPRQRIEVNFPVPDEPFLEPRSKAKRRKKKWEFNPDLPVLVTRSASRPLPSNDQFTTWNVRVANSATIGVPQRLISSFSVDVLILLEPFICGDQIPSVCRKLGLGGGLHSNNGKIWVLWSDRCSVRPIGSLPNPSSATSPWTAPLLPSSRPSTGYIPEPSGDCFGKTSWPTLRPSGLTLGGSAETSMSPCTPTTSLGQLAFTVRC